MHTMNEIELWREHRNELLREAKTGRVARRLRVERPKRWLKVTRAKKNPLQSRFATVREGGR